MLIGILGFLPGITTDDGLLLGIFAVNALHNIVHILAGGVLIWAAFTTGAMAVQVNRVLAVVFLLLFFASFIAPLAEQVALNAPDTVLHLATFAITAYLGFIAPARGMA